MLVAEIDSGDSQTLQEVMNKASERTIASSGSSNAPKAKNKRRRRNEDDEVDENDPQNSIVTIDISGNDSTSIETVRQRVCSCNLNGTNGWLYIEWKWKRSKRC